MNVHTYKEKASAREVYELITKGSDEVAIENAVKAALEAQFNNARTYQESKGRAFDLSWEHFYNKLATSHRRKQMGKKMKTGNFDGFMKSNYGYIISWRSRQAYLAGVLNDETAVYLNRVDAKRAVQFGPGDTHSEESIELIRAYRLGSKQTDATKAKISRSLKGHEVTEDTRALISAGSKGKPKSPEHREKMRLAALARQARIRMEKEQNNVG